VRRCLNGDVKPQGHGCLGGVGIDECHEFDDFDT